MTRRFGDFDPDETETLRAIVHDLALLDLEELTLGRLTAAVRQIALRARAVRRKHVTDPGGDL